ncbi:SGNH hydrolase domain-containing protein [Micromonosporaceae bacterium Da 78-11]
MKIPPLFRLLIVPAVAGLLTACAPGQPPRQSPVARSPAARSPAPAEDIGFDNAGCEAAPQADRVEACTFGDPAGSTEVVLYGDSYAAMWLPALAEIADRRDWRLRLYGKPACPAPRLTVVDQRRGRPFAECDRFRDYVVGRIRAERPRLVVVASGSFGQRTGRNMPVTAARWQAGLSRTLTALRLTGARVVLLGEAPVLRESGPDCLAEHAGSVTACSTPLAEATGRVWHAADRAAAAASGAGYVPVLPWLCGSTCTPVIGDVTVYRNRFYLTATYARRLSGVLEDALGLPADAAP